ncbi:hypothetical protein DMUE_1884 [Dictyocoela muelleri]|nr:hypothetical protein DMUE_1884 [Dictyocoela muelleri]
MNSIKFIKCQRNSDICIHDGFIYNKDRHVVMGFKYRFHLRYCSGRPFLYYDKNAILSMTKHIHNVENAKINHLLLKQEIYGKAIETNELFDDVFQPYYH